MTARDAMVFEENEVYCAVIMQVFGYFNVFYSRLKQKADTVEGNVLNSNRTKVCSTVSTEILTFFANVVIN
jgi:hypothetical protein